MGSNPTLDLVSCCGQGLFGLTYLIKWFPAVVPWPRQWFARVLLLQVECLNFTSARSIGTLPLGRVVLDSAIIALVKYPRGFESHTRPLLPRLL